MTNILNFPGNPTPADADGASTRYNLSAADFKALNQETKALALKLVDEAEDNTPFADLVRLVVLTRLEHGACLERILDRLNGDAP